MKPYNWQQKDWSAFKFSLEAVEDALFLFAEKTGKVSGIVIALPGGLKMNAVLA